ncbi:MAG: hypothetical protein HZC55_10190 [Verrucomicrobia bacterium]|nr:hypothetical protein [Verrucomicrobiota bacterium]
MTYRGRLIARDSGATAEPIRLTSDPGWGDGEAVLSGAARITGGWTRGATHPDLPAPARVWYRDLDYVPRTLWLVRGATASRIPLARLPNWKISDPEDIKSEWWSWDYPGGKSFDVFMRNEQGKELVLGIDTRHLTGSRDLYLGAIIWAEFGWVDGTPYPSYVQGFDGEKRGLGFEGYLGSARSRKIARHHRYYLEDKPHYLDDPEGEFWFERRGNGGRLHLIPPAGIDPNDATFEAGRESTLLHLADRDHLVISGLVFRFTNVTWNLTELPWGEKFALKEHVHPAAIRVWGGGRDLTIAHCTFEHVNSAILMKAVTPGRPLDRVAVTDCAIRDTDHHGIAIQEGIQWGHALPDEGGHLYDVRILRNFLARVGQRPARVGSGNAIDVGNAQTLEVAGNIIERPWHAGINVHGAKISGNTRDVPLTRILIHHNRVTDGIRTGDDCGNIETWQGGPAYVYNNVSGNPGGFRNASWQEGRNNPNRPGAARFGMAYYLDGAFKNYYFNNIGWGLSADPWSPVGATAMFQEIISYENAFFNNTAYNFVKGTRRQAPQAGRNKFLGNVWDGIGDWVFWHTTPARSAAQGNEADAGPAREHYALETNAIAGNVFHRITGKFAAFKPSGQWHETLDDSRRALTGAGALAGEIGVIAPRPPLLDPANRDFRPTADSAVVDRGARVFVPWALHGTVGEWHFHASPATPARILDEHWYMAPYYVRRDDYHTLPTFPLTVVHGGADAFVASPLDDWTGGALRFDGATRFATCPNADLDRSLDYKVDFRWDRRPSETRTASGRDFKSPQIHDTNFLLEVIFRAEPASTPAVLVEKRRGHGYGLGLNHEGKVIFEAASPAGSHALTGSSSLRDGKWHHILAEADRATRTLTLYVDGRKNGTAAGPGPGDSLANPGDLFVGGTPGGRHFRGDIDFLRIALGTLADARTDIAELHAWQFSGPFLRDFAGRTPLGKRDAGALEKTD